MRTLGEMVFVIFAIGLPAFLILCRPFIRQWFELKHKRLEIDARLAAEKAAQYVARSGEIEQRLATIERIVTDQPNRLAREIDQLQVGARQ